MRKIPVLVVVLTLFSSVAQASFLLDLLRGSEPEGGMHLGYGGGLTDSVKPTSVKHFDKTRNFLMDFDAGRILVLNSGLRFGHDNATSVDFNNGTRPAEIYISTIHIGLKLQVPTGFLRPFVGGGVMGGYISVSDPTERDNHNWLVAFSDEASGIHATYLQGGMDVSLSKEAAIRLGYHHQFIKTNSFKNLNGKPLDFEHAMISAGIVFGNLTK